MIYFIITIWLFFGVVNSWIITVNQTYLTLANALICFIVGPSSLIYVTALWIMENTDDIVLFKGKDY